MNKVGIWGWRYAALSLTAAVALATGITTLASTAGATSPEPIVLGTGADISKMCGNKPTVVGLVDGAGGDTWRKIVLAELKDEASKCPNITQILYTDGAGDPAKTNSDMNSLVAQGVNIMIIFPDFGAAMLPAMRKAVAAGVIVVPYNVKLNGREGKDYSYNVYQDVEKNAVTWVDWLGTNLKKGNVIYFSGPAGNAFSVSVMKSINTAVDKYPNIKLLQDTHVATNWNPADAQKAAAGVIARYGQVDGFMIENGTAAIGVVRAFQQAGLPVPFIASLASTNELNCMVIDAKASGKPWNYMTLEGTSTQVRNALRRGMAAYQETEDSDPLAMRAAVWADSFAGLDPKCNRDAPPDADLSGLLSDEKMLEVFR